MEKYMTLDNLEVGLKFTAIISSGIWSGGAIYAGASQLPGLLAQTDIQQTMLNLRYFWPRAKQMVRIHFLVCSIHRQTGMRILTCV